MVSSTRSTVAVDYFENSNLGSGMRSIAQVVSAKPFADNSEDKQSYRVIGTVDIDGKGTLHDIAHVDPFIFLDETCMKGREAWPFVKHPHAGLVAMTYLISGEIRSWDSHQGTQPFTNTAGGLYYINSGNGILHEEEALIENAPHRWLQLWMNPGLDLPQLPRASTQLIKADQIPVYETAAVTIRVVIGSVFGLTSPAKPDWPIQYLHVMLQPAASVTLPLAATSWQGFCYVLEGSGQFGAAGMVGNQRDCLVLDNKDADTFTVTNHHTRLLEFVFLCGAPHHQHFYKILGGGGALIAAVKPRLGRRCSDFNVTLMILVNKFVPKQWSMFVKAKMLIVWAVVSSLRVVQ